MAQYGPYAVNASVPEILVTVSGSGLNPTFAGGRPRSDPRITAATNLSMAFLQGLVNAHITLPLLNFIGPKYTRCASTRSRAAPLRHRSV